MSFDTETTSLDALNAELVGIAFSWEISYWILSTISKIEINVKSLISKAKVFLKVKKLLKMVII